MTIPDLLEHLRDRAVSLLSDPTTTPATQEDLDRAMQLEVSKLVRAGRWQDEGQGLQWAQSADLVMLLALSAALTPEEMQPLFQARFGTTAADVLSRVKQCDQFAKYVTMNHAMVAYRATVLPKLMVHTQSAPPHLPMATSMPPAASPPMAFPSSFPATPFAPSGTGFASPPSQPLPLPPPSSKGGSSAKSHKPPKSGTSPDIASLAPNWERLMG
jgi:hypothetical protein